MKNKILKCNIAFVFLIMLFSNCTYAISNEFNKIINTIEVKRYNNQGYEINEEIYYKYKKIVYGNPEMMYKSNAQDWIKKDDGKWVKNNERGEYKLLGYNVIGEVVVNNYFKSIKEEDFVSPLKWKYIQVEDSKNTISNKNKYKFSEVKDFLLNQKLIYNGVKYNITPNEIGVDKIIVDSYPTWQNQGVIQVNRVDEENIIKQEILYTDPLAPNMQANIQLSCKLSSLEIGILKDYIVVPINYYISLTNINDNVKENQIKKIQIDIYFNNIFVDRIVMSGKTEKSGISNIKIYRTDYEGRYFYQRFIKKTVVNGNFKARVKVFSNFSTDIPLYGKDEINVPITIKPRLVTSEYIPPAVRGNYVMLNEQEYELPIYSYPEYDDSNSKDEVDKEMIKDNDDDDKNNEEDNKNIGNNTEYIKDIKLGIIKYDKNEKVYNNLNKTLTTNEADSEGFICAGQNLGLELRTSKNVEKIDIKILGDSSIKNFDSKTKKFEWDDNIKNNYITRFNLLEEYYNFYSRDFYEMIRNNESEDIYTFEYLIPYGTKQTLHSWNTIREITSNSIINSQMIMSRISDPYIIELDVYVKENDKIIKKETKQIKFDIFENWKNLYNRDITQYIINK